MKIENGELKIKVFFFEKPFEISKSIAEGNTIILNSKLSILNYLSVSCPTNCNLLLTKQPVSDYNEPIICKCGEKKSTLAETVREPSKVRVGTEEAAEHGLGAGLSIGRQLRVRPLQRQ